MALVRVYCGLASTPPATTQGATEGRLTVAVVDDAGRLLDVCNVRDDPAGYAELSSLLAERSGGTASTAVAADTDSHQVTLLLAAAGWALAIADEEAIDDFAERFSDDDSAEEVAAPQTERRAVGLARALQAGALGATTRSTPREMNALKPVLTAHAALAAGRQGAAVALREVLRELYPAALRAYPDPADPVPLAILDALPEPGMLAAGTVTRGRDAAIVAQLSEAGVADLATITESITALRVAIEESPRRSVSARTPAATVAETIRYAVAAVRACDNAINVLVGLLTEKATPVQLPVQSPAATGGRRAVNPALRTIREMNAEPAHAAPPSRRSRNQNAPVTTMAEPRSSVIESGRPVAEPRPAMADPRSPAAETRQPMPAAMDAGPFAMPRPAAAHARPDVADPVPAAGPTTPASAPPVTPTSVPPVGPSPTSAPPGVLWPSSPWAASPGATPPYGQPGATQAAQFGPSQVSAPPSAADPYRPSEAGFGYTGAHPAVPVPSPRLAPDVGAPGSRSTWPLNGSGTATDEQVRRPAGDPLNPTSLPSAVPPPTVLEQPGIASPPPLREGRVRPPWQDDDLPSEPPQLRLVEPADTGDRIMRDDRTVFDRLAETTGFKRSEVSGPDPLTGPMPVPSSTRFDNTSGEYRPPLRLVETEGPARNGNGHKPAESYGPPVGDADSDSDLLIFSEIRSAWFTGHVEQSSTSLDWTNPADAGWQAAERASRPVLGESTPAGLPRRVPQANLVPGSALPPAEERPLRIVRDAKSMAAHTTGYFRGSRRGEQVRGFAVGGRPGRESAIGWDFSRDSWDDDGRDRQLGRDNRSAAQQR